MAKTPKTTTAPTGNIAPFGLRMLPELRQKIEESATAAGRSMNAEIVARLNRSFSMPDLSGQTTTLGKEGEVIRRDIVQHIADLQEMLEKANWMAGSLSLYEPVREERERRELLGPSIDDCNN